MRWLIFLLLIASVSADPSRFLPDRCDFNDDFTCGDYSIRNDEYLLRLELASTSDVIVTSIYAEHWELGNFSVIYADSLMSEERMWKTGEMQTLLIPYQQNPMIPGNKDKFLLHIEYYPENMQLSKQSVGEVFATVNSVKDYRWVARWLGLTALLSLLIMLGLAVKKRYILIICPAIMYAMWWSLLNILVFAAAFGIGWGFMRKKAKKTNFYIIAGCMLFNLFLTFAYFGTI